MGSAVSEFSEVDGLAEGPLFLLWNTTAFGGHSIFAQWNGFTFDLYGDIQREDWFGEVERVDDVADWALDLLAAYERLPFVPGDFARLRAPRS